VDQLNEFFNIRLLCSFFLQLLLLDDVGDAELCKLGSGSSVESELIIWCTSLRDNSIGMPMYFTGLFQFASRWLR
jgi:hypothetical protein